MVVSRHFDDDSCSKRARSSEHTIILKTQEPINRKFLKLMTLITKTFQESL